MTETMTGLLKLGGADRGARDSHPLPRRRRGRGRWVIECLAAATSICSRRTRRCSPGTGIGG